jgi:hypothetical protein
MKKKRKIFQTSEEREAWRAEGERIQRDLRAHMARIEAELAEHRKKAS